MVRIMIIRVWRTLVLVIMLVNLSNYGSCMGTIELKRSDFPAVLMYHDIKTTEINGFDVSVKDFGQQLDWLVTNKYNTLSIDEFVDCLVQNKPFPEKSVLITFDDGYDGVYNYAAPELHKRGMKAAFFIIKDDIGSPDILYQGYTWELLREKAA